MQASAPVRIDYLRWTKQYGQAMPLLALRYSPAFMELADCFLQCGTGQASCPCQLMSPVGQGAKRVLAAHFDLSVSLVGSTRLISFLLLAPARVLIIQIQPWIRVSQASCSLDWRLSRLAVSQRSNEPVSVRMSRAVDGPSCTWARSTSCSQHRSCQSSWPSLT